MPVYSVVKYVCFVDPIPYGVYWMVCGGWQFGSGGIDVGTQGFNYDIDVYNC